MRISSVVLLFYYDSLELAGLQQGRGVVDPLQLLGCHRFAQLLQLTVDLFVIRL